MKYHSPLTTHDSPLTMSSISYYRPRKKQHAPHSQDGHRSLAVTFDPEDVAENLLSYVIKRGGKVSTKQLQPWYKEHPSALKVWIKQEGGITELAKRSHCLTVTDPRAKDVFIQTPEYEYAESAAAHEATGQANPSDEKIEELWSKILHLEESHRELTRTVLALQNIFETRGFKAASEEDASEDSALADQVLAAYDAAPTAAASNDGPEIEEIE